jgi:hypothetical protein
MVIINLLLLAACSHVRYVPEIPDDSGVLFDHDSLVYSIPPTHPIDKLKLSFRGVKDGNKLHLHLRFIRKQNLKSGNHEVLDPKEQTVQIAGEGPWLTPVKVHASSSSKPLIKLNNAERQAIDLIYELPLENGETPRLEFFTFRWKIQNIPGDTGVHTVRFDRRHSSISSSNGDADFAAFGDTDDPSWYPNDWGWW